MNELEVQLRNICIAIKQRSKNGVELAMKEIKKLVAKGDLTKKEVNERIDKFNVEREWERPIGLELL